MSDVHDTEPPAPRATQLKRILASVDKLNADELEIIAVVCERVSGQGRTTYGPLDLSRDKRDFRREALEECVDGLAYAACGIIRERRMGRPLGRRGVPRRGR